MIGVILWAVKNQKAIKGWRKSAESILTADPVEGAKALGEVLTASATVYQQQHTASYETGRMIDDEVVHQGYIDTFERATGAIRRLAHKAGSKAKRDGQ